jgi:hypothetical protein
MSVSHGGGIARLGTSDFDEDRTHDAIKASGSAGFKCGNLQ